MKKSICFIAILSLFLLTVLCACGGEPTPAPAKDYVFSIGGQRLALDTDFASVASALGEPRSYDESPSCAFEGLDKVYGYNGFEVRTYPDGAKDKIYSVKLIDDGVATPEGIRIGNSAAEVDRVYGTVYTAAGENRKYAGDTMDLQILMSGGFVTGIVYQHR